MIESEQSSAYTVSQAMLAAKNTLETIRLVVIGEVSEFKVSKGGHAFFTVRDDKSSMPCVMWKPAYASMGTELQPGTQVEIQGKFSCFAAKGDLQFVVSAVQIEGEGKLRMQVAKLAEKLSDEGLMDTSRKRPTPALPRRIGVITSPRGKAIEDVLRTLRRRYPLGEVCFYGVTVEGPTAARQMIDAFEAAWGTPDPLDVILLVRGGGSYEDLMPFNDEALARTVAASPIPVVTGIGHEPDNSICDMVADRRCSTPTAAAEAVALSVAELASKLKNARGSLQQALQSFVKERALNLEKLAERPIWQDSYALTSEYHQTLANMEERLARAIPEAMRKDEHALELLRGRLVNIGPQICAGAQKDLALSAATLDALSPLKTLSRGYSIAYAEDGRSVIDSVAGVSVGQSIQVQVKDGKLACTVSQVEGSAHV